MSDTRLFTELSREEKEVLLGELKSLKLSCSPANMTVNEIEELIANAKNSELAATDNANISTIGTDGMPSEGDNSVVENAQNDKTEPAESVIPLVNESPKTDETKSIQPQEDKNQQKQKKKADKDVFNGVCITCGEKVFNNKCLGCGRKY